MSPRMPGWLADDGDLGALLAALEPHVHVVEVDVDLSSTGGRKVRVRAVALPSAAVRGATTPAEVRGALHGVMEAALAVVDQSAWEYVDAPIIELTGRVDVEAALWALDGDGRIVMVTPEKRRVVDLEGRLDVTLIEREKSP